MAKNSASLLGMCLGEFLGTFLLVFLGNMAVAVAVFAGGYDLTGVALMWGMGVMLGVYIAGAASGGHINPAVTVTLWALKRFPGGQVVPYIFSQVAGAFVAAAAIYLCWSGNWVPAAEKMGIEVGGEGSQKLMMIFSCFYPNPAAFGTDAAGLARVGTGSAFLAEVIMTAILLMAVLALTSDRSPIAPKSNLAPFFIGLTVFAMVGIGGPATMTAINPARDFGPRLFGAVLGYGDIAFPGPQGHEWWLYIVAPIVGGLLGGLIYQKGVNRFLSASSS
jgi:glycerol uptake facilitator protein